MRNTLKTLAVAAFAAAVSTTAFAQDLRVNYQDLDLSQPSGAAAFNARVDQAASAFCRGRDGAVSGPNREARACERAAKLEVRMSLPTEQRRQVVAAASTDSVIQVAQR
jgi:UrcA family protein